MDKFRAVAPLHANQPPFNLFEREIEQDVLPYNRRNKIVTLAYGALCRGLLAGKMTAATEFTGDDLRRNDPKFQSPRFEQYLQAVKQLDRFAADNYGKSVLHLALRWILDKQPNSIALWGARKPEQLDPVEQVYGWKLDASALAAIDRILTATITSPVGPESWRRLRKRRLRKAPRIDVGPRGVLPPRAAKHTGKRTATKRDNS